MKIHIVFSICYTINEKKVGLINNKNTIKIGFKTLTSTEKVSS